MVQSVRNTAPPEVLHTSHDVPLALTAWSPIDDVVTVYHFFSQRLGLLSLKGIGGVSDESGQNEIWVSSYPDFEQIL
jgi:hypothetical protein